MKKLIVSLSVILIAALLGIGGWYLFKSAGPRERLQGEKGSRVLVEELSFYKRREKIFGKVFKPADENGNFPDSLGTRPLVIYLHAPLVTANPEAILRTVVSKGVIGYSATFHGQKSEISFYVKKLANEPFVDDELIFLVSDGLADEAAASFASKARNRVAGHLAIDPTVPATAVGRITAFLEENGAMK